MTDTQATLYECWAAKIKPIINGILGGSLDGSGKKVVIYDTGSVKGHLRVQRMDTGLFELGFLGKQGSGQERRNAWDANKAVEALGNLLNGQVVAHKEQPHWLVITFDPRPMLAPHPQYVLVVRSVEDLIKIIDTAPDPHVHHARTVTFEDGGYKAIVDLLVLRLGDTGDHMVEATPRRVDAHNWNVDGLTDALEFHFGENKVSVLDATATLSVTIHAEPQHN